MLLVAALVGVQAVHDQLPWVPIPYLAALLVLPIVTWRLARWRAASRRVRGPALVVTLTALVALLPVPWMTANLTNPPGTAWRLDGRLTIDGELVDPPGSWYWLTVGRPPVVAELVRSWLFNAPPPHDLRQGSTISRPEFNEPAAAAVGLRRAGRDIEFAFVVEASNPAVGGLPSSPRLTKLNGIPLLSRENWRNALGTLGARNTLTTEGGDVYWFDGRLVPYSRIALFDRPVDRVNASVGGSVAGLPPVRWFRGLALGISHGLMVALMAYTHESGLDLARNRAIAGTGGIRGDGSVAPIGGLAAKATAARDVGADILLFPAEQASDLAEFEPGEMRLTPVSSLDDAIDALRR